MRGLRERVVVDALVGEADPLGRLTVEHLSEEHGRCRDLRTDDAPQHPRVAPAGVQADLDEAGVELRPLRRDPQVAAERHVHAGADRRPVDRRDRGQR